MPGNPREMITVAERRCPVRIRIAVPPAGLGQRHTQITAWLDENCGVEGWAITASGTRGVLNDALSIYSRMPCSRAHSSPAGAPGRRSRRPGACSGCGSMNLSHGSGPHCTGLTVTGENRPTDCSNAADKPIKAATMPTLVLPPSLDPSRLQDHLIDTAAQAAGWISNHLRIVSRNTRDQPGDRSNSRPTNLIR